MSNTTLSTYINIHYYSDKLFEYFRISNFKALQYDLDDNYHLKQLVKIF